MLDAINDVQAFGLIALLLVATAGAGKAALLGLEEHRPILLLGGWLAAIAGSVAVLVAWPSVVNGLRPFWSEPLVAAFVRRMTCR